MPLSTRMFRSPFVQTLLPPQRLWRAVEHDIRAWPCEPGAVERDLVRIGTNNQRRRSAELNVFDSETQLGEVCCATIQPVKFWSSSSKLPSALIVPLTRPERRTALPGITIWNRFVRSALVNVVSKLDANDGLARLIRRALLVVVQEA